MATTNLGRIQGAGHFMSTAAPTVASVISIALSTITPTNIKPLVGDSILFCNGGVRLVTAVTATTATCGAVVATLSGPGIPRGGETDQILRKNDAMDFVVEWTGLKTVGGQSLLGTGDIPLPTGGGGEEPKPNIVKLTENVDLTDSDVNDKGENWDDITYVFKKFYDLDLKQFDQVTNITENPITWTWNRGEVVVTIKPDDIYIVENAYTLTLIPPEFKKILGGGFIENYGDGYERDIDTFVDMCFSIAGVSDIPKRWKIKFYSTEADATYQSGLKTLQARHYFVAFQDFYMPYFEIYTIDPYSGDEFLEVYVRALSWRNAYYLYASSSSIPYVQPSLGLIDTHGRFRDPDVSTISLDNMHFKIIRLEDDE